MTDHLFYVGAVGSLVPLPDVLSDTAVADVLVGGAHASAGGTQTVDGVVKGSWTWTWPMLTHTQRAYVTALRAGTVGGPLRLVNPRDANRLPVDVASGGSARRSPTGFAATANGIPADTTNPGPPGPAPADDTGLEGGGEPGEVGTSTLRFRRHDQIPATRSSLAPHLLVAGGVGWSVSRGGGVLWPAWRDTPGRWRLPLLPDEPVRLSMWVCATVPVSVRIGWDEHRRTGTLAKTGSPVVLRPDRWRQISRTVTPGAAGTRAESVALTPTLILDPTDPDGVRTPAVEVFTTCWSATALDADELPASVTPLCDTLDPGAGWRAGGGAPEVQVAGGSTTHKLPWFADTGLTLVEV